MDRSITPRIHSLVVDAAQAIRQAKYEGSSTLRQEPRPAVDSPWDTPDLPRQAMTALDDALQALSVVSALYAVQEQQERREREAREAAAHHAEVWAGANGRV